MLKVMKKGGKTVEAYRLGDSSSVLDRMIGEGRIRLLSDGTFEVMSREAVQGGSGHGQIVRQGDYIKVDSAGFPYPNRADYFELNHIRIGDNKYEQIPSVLAAWTVDDPVGPEIEFLQKEKGLVIHREDFEHTFTAPLWGTIESAPADAVIVFYSIVYADDNSITDAVFNFVAREEFEKDYRILIET